MDVLPGAYDLPMTRLNSAEFHSLSFVGRIWLCRIPREFVFAPEGWKTRKTPKGLPNFGKPGVVIVNLDVRFTGCEYRSQILTL